MMIITRWLLSLSSQADSPPRPTITNAATNHFHHILLALKIASIIILSKRLPLR
jgi:hypothetical protein